MDASGPLTPVRSAAMVTEHSLARSGLELQAPGLHQVACPITPRRRAHGLDRNVDQKRRTESVKASYEALCIPT